MTHISSNATQVVGTVCVLPLSNTYGILTLIALCSFLFYYYFIYLLNIYLLSSVFYLTFLLSYTPFLFSLSLNIL